MSASFSVDGIRGAQSAYYEEIRSLASEYAAMVKASEEGEADQDPEDWLHETIDGHEWVIYTWKARLVLVCSDNPDAYEEDMGEKPASPEVAAYAAMQRDVREAAEGL